MKETYHESLYREHRELAFKQFNGTGGLSESEHARLEEIREELDLVEARQAGSNVVYLKAEDKELAYLNQIDAILGQINHRLRIIQLKNVFTSDSERIRIKPQPETAQPMENPDGA